MRASRDYEIDRPAYPGARSLREAAARSRDGISNAAVARGEAIKTPVQNLANSDAANAGET